MFETEDQSGFCFQQIHIDAARNSTDDFNPFHDPYKWDRIKSNPFGSPVVLGFQLEALVEYLVTRYREAQGEQTLIDQRGLKFVNFQFTFADVVRPGEILTVEIKGSTNRIREDGQLSNRIAVRKQGSLVLLGSQRETDRPLFLGDLDFSHLGDPDQYQDRSYVDNNQYFLKRKFMNTGNGKNFVAGSLANQHYYFDELENRVRFPAMFPVALLSCALLEKARQADYDFEGNPEVYTEHKISVDRDLLHNLKSNDRLNILVHGPKDRPLDQGLKGATIRPLTYQCFGLLGSHRILYRAEVSAAPLAQIVATLSGRKSVP